MTYEFKLPDLGEGLTEGEVARWLVTEGQQVAEDEPLVEIHHRGRGPFLAGGKLRRFERNPRRLAGLPDGEESAGRDGDGGPLASGL